MKISEVFPKKYATGEDLKGKPYTLTVARVDMETMHPQPGAPAERKPVLYLDGTTRGIILNPPLARQIALLLGDETAEWTGKKITIFPQPMTVAGTPRIAIRARAATNGTTQAPEALTEDEE